jgi:hypothetical protein
MRLRPTGCLMIVLIVSCLGCTTHSSSLEPYINGQYVEGLQHLACLRGGHPRDCKKIPPKPVETAQAQTMAPTISAQ